MLKVGAFGFGGPLVTLNLMKEAFVHKRAWLSEKEFLERMGMVKLLPGPVSSLMAIALGRKFFGVWASLASLLAYLLPAFLIISVWDFAEPLLHQYISESLGESVLWSFRLYIVSAILVAAMKLLRDAWRNFPFTTAWKLLLFASILAMSFVASSYGLVETEILGLS